MKKFADEFIFLTSSYTLAPGREGCAVEHLFISAQALTL